MLPYWVLFGLCAINAVVSGSRRSLMLPISYSIVFLMVAFRLEVGGDWFSYVDQVRWQGEMGFLAAVSIGKDPLYRAMNVIAYEAGLGVMLPNVLCAAIFVAGLASLLRQSPDAALGLVAAIPYLVVVVAMGYTRQSAAIGFVMWGLSMARNQRPWAYVAFVLIASMAHRSAIAMMPLPFITQVRSSKLRTLAVLALTFLAYRVFLQDDAEDVYRAYVDSSYASKSSGGLVRVAMTAVSAFVYLNLIKPGEAVGLQRGFWTVASWAGLVSLPLALVTPTVIDRAALYLIPLQMHVAASALNAIRPEERSLARFVIISGFALVQFVWLFYAQNRESWLPYRSLIIPQV